MIKRPDPNLHFRLMFFTYKFRDFFVPRMKILKEARIEEGFHVLDYGCGPGSYVAPLADLVGPSGKIYALDIHPLASQTVKRREIIRVVRKITSIPVALLIYCPSLLRKNIRKALLSADIVLPSQDATISGILAKFTPRPSA